MDAPATRAVAAVRAAGVEHGVHDLTDDPDPSLAPGRAMAAALDVETGRVFKTLVVEADGHAVVAVIPLDRTLDLKAMAREVGAKRAALASTADAERLTGYVVGGISPLGRLRRLQTVVDASATTHDTVFVSGGRRRLELELRPDDLVALTGGHLAPTAG